MFQQVLHRNDGICEDAEACASCPMMCREIVGSHVAAQNFNSRQTSVNQFLPEELQVPFPLQIRDPFKDFFEEGKTCGISTKKTGSNHLESHAFNA